MAKVTLTDLTSLANDTSATNSINENFQAIEDYINDNVLSRDTGAETNTMQNDIDMNSYSLNNLANINGESVTTILTSLLAQVGYAEEWAIKPEDTLVSTVAGGNGVDEYSAFHWAQKAEDEKIAAAASASAASTDAGLAATSASTAAAEAASAAAAFDAFDDIFLGAKASAPTLDNDGDALQTGTIYWNTSNSTLYIYDGGWNAAAFDVGTALFDADIGVTVQGYDADTAKLDVEQTFTAAQTGATQVNTSASGNVTLDFSAYNNFILTLTGNLTLDNPTTETVGQSGFIVFKQDGTGSRTLSLGTQYLNPGGTAPTLTTTASAIDVVGYCVAGDGQILLGSPLLAFS